MAEVNLTLGDPIEVKVTPAEGATNVSVSPAPQNLVQVQAAIATNGLQGADGAGVPSGGDAGQALVKNSSSDNDTKWAYIDKLHINVKNTTGATIPAGSVVYASGLQGNDILIDLADASDASKMPAIGFTYEDVGDGNKGDVISAGLLNQNIQSVTGAAVGKTMYVSAASAGAVTVTKPSGSGNLVQNVGVILKSNNDIVQKFKVSAIDRTNDIPNLDSGHFFLGGAPGRISEYQLPTGSPTNGQLLRANASGDLEFVNSNQITKNIGTVNLETSDTTRTLKIAEDGHLNIIDQQDASIFYIDEENKRVGINTTTLDKPAALFVNGDVLFKDDSTIGVEGGHEFNIGKIGSAGAAATVNVTADLSVSGNCTIDTNLKFGTGGNQLHANTTNTFEFGKNGSGSANYKFNSDVGTVTFDNTTDVELKNAGGLKIFNSSNSVSIQSPSLASSYTLTLPNSSGTDGYVLKTDGSGTTSWVDVTAVSDAILDSDFTADSGLMKKTGAGTYAIATANDDYQVPPSEGAFADGDKTKITRITVSSDVNLDNAIYTSTDNVSSASFVDTDDTFDSATDNLVPSQLAVKTYVDSQTKAAVYVDQSDAPQLHASVSEAEMKSLLNLEDADIRGLINVGASLGSGSLTYNAAVGSIFYSGPTDAQIRAPFGAASSGSGSLSYSASTGVFTYTGPDLSSYLTSVSEADVTAHEAALSIATTQLTGLSATGSVSGITLNQTNGTFVLGGSLNTIPISGGGTGATNAPGARSALGVDAAGTDNSTDVTLAAVAGNYLTITGQEITSGTVPLTLGGTGATSAAGARTALDLDDSDIRSKFSAGTGITISGSGEIASTVSGGIDAVEDDSTPALGGDLNVNGYEITSNTSQNITIAAGTNGDVNIDGDPVNIKHAGSTKLNTTTTGVQITGNAVLVDDDEVQLGDTSDLRLFHDSDDGANGTSKIFGKQDLDIISSSNIEISSTSQLEVKHGDDVQIRSVASGGVELYHDGTKKIETASDGVRVSGGVQVTDGYVTRFNGLETDANASLSSAGNHRGADILANFYPTASVDAGKLYNADGTNGWELADKDADNTSASLLAIATDDGDADTMITKGIVRVHDIAGTSPSKGKTVYVGDSGIPTVTRPSADGDIVRIIGYVYDETDNVIFFNPSPDFIEVA